MPGNFSNFLSTILLEVTDDTVALRQRRIHLEPTLTFAALRTSPYAAFSFRGRCPLFVCGMLWYVSVMRC